MESNQLIKFDDAWLGLGDLDQLTLPTNHMIGRDKKDIERPDLHLVKLLKKPEYFGSTAKLLLDIELHPMQIAILNELWYRPFPMYVASRGWGKAETLDMPLLTDKGWIKMGQVKPGNRVYGRDGKLHKVIAVHPQGKKQVCRITLLDGRTVDCCEDHLWVVKRNDGKELTVDTKTIIKKHVFLKNDKSYGGNIYKYRIPNCEPIEQPKQTLPIDPYILGCLLGDGCLTTLTPKISSNDNFIIEEFKIRLPGFKIKKDISNNNYTISDNNKDLNTITRVYKSGKKIKYKSKIKNRLTSLIKELKLNVGCKNKFIPEIYKKSCIEDRMEIVRGLIDTDGHVSKNGAIEFTNTCEKLVDDLIDILRSLGITCTKKIDDRSDQLMKLPQGTISNRKPYFRVYINTSKPIAKLPRKLNRIKNNKTNAENYVSIIKAEYLNEHKEMQCITVDNPDHTYITKDYVVTHNSFLLALYAVLKCTFIPGTKIVIVGSAFRQSKIIFEYMETIWNNSPILRSIFNSDRDGPRRDVDRCTIRLGDSWAIAIPLGTGEKIRGLRAHTIIADEFASISPEIYETVVSGFAAVSANPIQNVKEEARKQAMIEHGIWTDELTDLQLKKNNQAIIAGTADYSFKHFASYWKRYKHIVESQGDQRKLEEIFNGEIPSSFDWKDYSIIRIPYELVPRGFMDDKQVGKSKATVHSSTYNMEYGAVFPEDSDGFFKRSLIERCVANDSNPIEINGEPIVFDVAVKGDPRLQYVYGIDPASEKDNFSIVILELHKTHSRVVYCWTTNRTNFKERQKTGLVTEHDFYGFCARKIRDLMKSFPPARIGMDAQGGGVAIEESLHDPQKLQDGELLIWPVIEEDKEKDTDDKAGLHILELIQFARADWTAQANHGLKMDLESKILLFPRFDNLSLALTLERENQNILDADFTNLYDTESGCMIEIEELKNELSTIVMSQTSNGPNARDRWDTPETKLPNGKKGKLRKDRYSSLVIANMLARQLNKSIEPVKFALIGSNLKEAGKKSKGGAMYYGPEWFTSGANTNIYQGIYRK